MKFIFKILDQQYEIQGAELFSNKNFVHIKSLYEKEEIFICEIPSRNKGELLISELFT